MRPRGRIAIVVVAALVVTGAVSAALAQRRAALARPAITSHPSDPTSFRKATFQFRVRQARVGFQCSLDGSTFAPCSSPMTYAGPLREGKHKFRVRASLGTRRSGADSWTWRVDATAPGRPTITDAPDAATSSRSGTIRFRDSERGLSFHCRLDGAGWRRCSSPVSYGGLRDGRHTFSVLAIDKSGNSSSAAATTWLVDTSAPPAPTITSHPSEPTDSTAAAFTFTDSEPGLSFECRLQSTSDTGWAACSSPYDGVAHEGENRFDVRARDGAGNSSDAASFSWNVLQASQQDPGVPFSISGDAVGLLYPGASVPVNLVFANPNTVAITVTSATVTISGTSTSACPVTGNFSVGAQLAVSVSVPAGATISLSQLGVPQASWPQLTMASPPADQDGCKNATLHLSYSGSAHS